MADTVRTRTALIALLADNTTGAVTEQTMRDFLVSGFSCVPYAAKTSVYTITTDDCIVYAGGTSSYAVNLPTAASMIGRFVFIKKTSTISYSITVKPNGAETIDGATTQVMTAQYSCMMLHSDGSNWYIL